MKALWLLGAFVTAALVVPATNVAFVAYIIGGDRAAVASWIGATAGIVLAGYMAGKAAR